MATQPSSVLQPQPLSNSFGPRPVHCLGWIAIEFGRLEYIVKLALKNLVGQGFRKGLREAESKYQISAIVRDAISRASSNEQWHRH